MIKCTLCKSTDMVRVTIKASKRKVAVCNECSSVYDVDKDGNPVYGHDPKDVEYFKKLEASFDSWDELENIVPYNKV